MQNLPLGKKLCSRYAVLLCCKMCVGLLVSCCLLERHHDSCRTVRMVQGNWTSKDKELFTRAPFMAPYILPLAYEINALPSQLPNFPRGEAAKSVSGSLGHRTLNCGIKIFHPPLPAHFSAAAALWKSADLTAAPFLAWSIVGSRQCKLDSSLSHSHRVGCAPSLGTREVQRWHTHTYIHVCRYATNNFRPEVFWLSV